MTAGPSEGDWLGNFQPKKNLQKVSSSNGWLVNRRRFLFTVVRFFSPLALKAYYCELRFVSLALLLNTCMVRLFGSSK